MSRFLNTIFITGLSGYLTGWIGILAGITFSFFIKHRGRKFKGTALGFIGGLMLAIVCFDLLPESFEAGSIYIATVGITFGLILAVILDGRLEHNKVSVFNNKGHRFLKAAIFMAIGIGIHNIPSGVALGSLISTSPIKGFHLAIALILHGIPEGLAVGIFLRESNASTFSLIFISVLTSIPMGIGSVLGGIISKISPVVICISLAFAGGMILYIICRETLPSARDTWKGRMSTIGNVIGMIAGMLIVSFLD
ncbi:ZIP family metal transporter [Clostridium sp. OS1-26]|uniref:ZIP family metal transporter n=1 Tax=Clostridium sp. OS1-26 TaxID=3070681 RepID=UPI0027E0ECD6|nr:ZIP family metal transporter [Clostridium sp. OS1-26]WML37640.1 ZIP family metal transporter [Clostridium sp. OS1-26]